MRIFTTYFSKVSRLPAGIVPVSISLWPPRGWTGCAMPSLAPSKSILTEYKNNPDWPRYVDRFQSEILARRDPAQILAQLQQLTGGRDAALVCFEREPAQCHRSLVAQWLSANGAGEIKEWQPGM